MFVITENIMKRSILE